MGSVTEPDEQQLVRRVARGDRAGAARAAALPVLWTVLVLRYAPPMGQPPTRPTAPHRAHLDGAAAAPAATMTAVALAVAGTLAYAILGSRRVR